MRKQIPFLITTAVLALSITACGKSNKYDRDFAKEQAKIEAERKKREPEERHQRMLEELNVIRYHNFDGYNHSIYTFEIDGVKCIVTDMKGTGISCDYNDAHIAQNLAAREKRREAKKEQEREQYRILLEGQ
ncbi:MAG: hypothetical protein IJ187_06550 [Neisseriaceae bacterium]|nr:hypothetical protein [Neisseriaceae bacterium]